MFKVKRINKEDVQAVKFVDEVDDPRPIKGRDVFPEIYANIFFCARKKSGKSCGIFHTIQKCATKETRVIAFVSTLHRDPTWRTIKALCEKMKVEFHGYTSIKDPETKEDILDSIVKTLENENDKEEVVEEEQEEGVPKGFLGPFMYEDAMAMNKKTKKPKRPKERAPKIIFVFDDLSGELQTPSLTALMKKNRQFKSKLIIASQYWNDIALQARKQIDYVLIYRGLAQSLAKLQEIYNNCDLAVTFDTFLSLYRYCTAERFHFMWIDTVNSEFRKDFTHNIELVKDKKGDEVVEL